MTKEIELTKGYKAIVDDDVFEQLNGFKWCAAEMRKTVYATRLIRLHHLVIGFPPEGFVVDHINGDGLDNRRENLRFATNQNNVRHRVRQANNTSGYRGVSWHKGKQRWEANIRNNNKRVRLGRFKDIEDAARAYDKAAKEFFGKFAYLNFKE